METKGVIGKNEKGELIKLMMDEYMKNKEVKQRNQEIPHYEAFTGYLRHAEEFYVRFFQSQQAEITLIKEKHFEDMERFEVLYNNLKHKYDVLNSLYVEKTNEFIELKKKHEQTLKKQKKRDSKVS